MKPCAILQNNIDDLNCVTNFCLFLFRFILAYVGLSANKFFARYYQHKSNFTNLNQKSQTTLTTEVRSLNRKHINFELEWRILKTSHPYSAGANKCRLCLEEIFWIIYHPADSSLNCRKEFMSKCRHQRKFLLSEN